MRRSSQHCTESGESRYRSHSRSPFVSSSSLDASTHSRACFANNDVSPVILIFCPLAPMLPQDLDLSKFNTLISSSSSLHRPTKKYNYSIECLNYEQILDYVHMFSFWEEKFCVKMKHNSQREMEIEKKDILTF